MLRIEFSAEALLRTRFADRPAPLLDLGLGLATLRRRDVQFDQWRRTYRPQLSGPTIALFDLIPPSGAGPVFLDPISDGIEDGLDLVMSASRELITAELHRVVRTRSAVTPWIRDLLVRDRDAWTTLSAALRGGYDAIIGPRWPQIAAAHRTDIALRSRTMASEGIRAMLQNLHPGSTWDDTTLQIPVDSQLHVTTGPGGVVLMPSVFWAGRPLVAPLDDGSLLLVYAAAIPVPLIDAGDGDSLSNLLGPTRAAVLTGTTGALTTGELARLLGVSAASISMHTKILRNSGLITTAREGKAVVHSATALGAQLIASTASGY